MARYLSDLKVITINGTKVPFRDGTATIGLGGASSTIIISGQVPIGVNVTGTAATLSFSAVVQAGTDINKVYVIRDGQIRVQWDTGDEWLMIGATNEAPPEISGGTGDLTVTYNGKPWELVKLAG